MSFFRFWPILLGLPLVIGCELFGRIGTYNVQSVSASAGDQESIGETATGLTEDEKIELEEEQMEDPSALVNLIHKKLEDSSIPLERDEEPESNSERRVEPPATSSRVVVPSGIENWKLSDKQCLALLDEAGIKTHKPDFETPLVENPLLLDSPIEGVEIGPNWTQPSLRNEVMDCHLVLALIELARYSKSAGVVKIGFYSTYRPLNKPTQKCKKGKAGKRCRKQKKQWNRTKANKKKSQHRRALAIDIRWFEMVDGEKIDVLEDYDRKGGVEPCSYEASGKKAKFLQDFACQLHKKQIFNVMLTPNFNKAHHNHFHFDITPDATWYIIR